MTERTRFTISVENDVYEAFADLAHSSGVSLSRCIGDWLRDTAEAAQITTIRVNELRKNPQDALQAFLRDAIIPGMSIAQERFQALAWKAGAAGEAGAGGRSAPAQRGAAAAGSGRSAPPRPVIRGGKSPEQGKKAGGKVA